MTKEQYSFKKQNNNIRSTASTPISNIDGYDQASRNRAVKTLCDGEDLIRKKLSVRSYHLPGNNWLQDWAMYIGNNHLVFGLFCHHRLHPVTIKHRVIIFLGSIAFGLTVTNIVYLWYFCGGKNYNDTALSISLSGEVVDNLTENKISLNISNGMAMLWTMGAGVHAIFDLLLWHMIACVYCQRRDLHCLGWNMAIAIVSIFIAAASFVVLVRAYEDEEEDMQQQFSVINDVATKIHLQLNLGDREPDFHFLYGYLVELFASLFVYSPIVQTILFSGVLGCGMLPFLGGRPRSLRMEEDRVAKVSINTGRVIQV